MVTKTLSIKLDAEHRQRLRAAAEAAGQTPHWILRQAVARYLDAVERGVTAEEAIDAGAGRFAPWAELLREQSPQQAAISMACCIPDRERVPGLLAAARMPASAMVEAGALARRLTEAQQRIRRNALAPLVEKFSLSVEGSVALLCLAETLLQVPDKAMRDEMIRDRIRPGHWRRALGGSRSIFCNATIWHLLLTGERQAVYSEARLAAALDRTMERHGEPMVRQGVTVMAEFLSQHGVMGTTIAAAVANAHRHESQGLRSSYLLLARPARTEADAETHLAACEYALDTLGRATRGPGAYDAPGLTIQLSALHPRYQRTQRARVLAELYPRLRRLVLQARQYELGLTLAAERAEQWGLFLELLEPLCFEPELAGWNGIGVTLQANQKSGFRIADALIDLARRSGHRLMVRLVQGAYGFEAERRAQVLGLAESPVYAHSAYVDLAYIALARRLLAVPQLIFPQFATHRPEILACVHQLAGQGYYPGQYEFQGLHGQGGALHEPVVKILNRPYRIHGLVGSHCALLEYLVRSPATAIRPLYVTGPVPVTPEPQQPQPGLAARAEALMDGPVVDGTLGPEGLDLERETHLAALAAALAHVLSAPFSVLSEKPWLGKEAASGGEQQGTSGWIPAATGADVEAALQQAVAIAPIWQSTDPAIRAAALTRTAEVVERSLPRWVMLLVQESSLTLRRAVAEMRRVVEALCDAAKQVRCGFDHDTHRPLGPVACISSRTTPLAVLARQIAIALAVGNPVLIKPTIPGSLIAAELVRTLLDQGIPEGVLQLLTGSGKTVGARLAGDRRICGVLFSGSMEVARCLQRTVANRLDAEGRGVPLLACTPGLQVLLADASAVPEAVIDALVSTAFTDAGHGGMPVQLLCLQESIVEEVLSGLQATMIEQTLGSPFCLSTDIGPVGDATTRKALEQEVAAWEQQGHHVTRLVLRDSGSAHHGHFVVPTLIELESLAQWHPLPAGPVLYLLRYRRRDQPELLSQLNAMGEQVSLSVHTCMAETLVQLRECRRLAVVSVQGHGAVRPNCTPAVEAVLAGNGPRCDGPLYGYRLLSVRPANPWYGVTGQIALPDAPAQQEALLKPLFALQRWARRQGRTALTELCHRWAGHAANGAVWRVPAPAGECRYHVLQGCESVLCLAATEEDLLTQLAAVLAVGAMGIWPESPLSEALHDRLPRESQARIALIDDWPSSDLPFTVALHHGDSDQLRDLRERVAHRDGPLVTVHGYGPGETDLPLDVLMVERRFSMSAEIEPGQLIAMSRK